MKRLMVMPIPQRIATPRSEVQPAPVGMSSETALHREVRGEEHAERLDDEQAGRNSERDGASSVWIDTASRETPALAKAKSGRITKATGGCRSCSSRERAAGMNRASATPASVAWTPDFSTEVQEPSPTGIVRRNARHAGPIHQRKHSQHAEGCGEGGGGKVGGVAGGDDEHGAEVVEHGKREQEHLEPGARRLASGEQHAGAKAMSVAVGIAQPRSATGSPRLRAA